MSEEYYVNTDKSQLDVPWVIDRLRHSYWGSWLTPQSITMAIENSICFGVYETATGRQVGFARVMSDYATFSSVMDFIIEREKRRRGIGKMLMKVIVEHESVANTISILSTEDAASFYKKFGYCPIFAMQRNPRRK